MRHRIYNLPLISNSNTNNLFRYHLLCNYSNKNRLPSEYIEKNYSTKQNNLFISEKFNNKLHILKWNRKNQNNYVTRKKAQSTQSLIILDDTPNNSICDGSGGAYVKNKITDNEYPNIPFVLMAIPMEEKDYDNEDDDFGDSTDAVGSSFYVTEISAPSLPVGQGIPTLDDLTASLKTQTGFPGDYSELSDDLEALRQTELFESVAADVHPVKLKGKNNPVRIIFKFATREYPQMDSFRIEGSTILPESISEKVMTEYKKRGGGKVDMSTRYLIKNIIDGFYQERGYSFIITSFDGWEGGHPVANIAEGRVGSVKVVPVDDIGNPTENTKLNLRTVENEIRSIIKEGELFNVGAAYKALNIVYKTQMFESSRLIQMPDLENMLVDIEILVQEKPAKTVEIEMEWQLQPGLKGRQKLLDIVPSGSLVIENHNLRKTGAQISAMISTQNFLHLKDITDFKAAFTMPYCYGTGDIKKTALEINILQTHRLSPVFSPINRPEVMPIWNNRVGMKASLRESYSQNSKASWSVIAESISCLDESGTLCTMVTDKYPGKELNRNTETGLPTTLSGSGHDRIVSLRSDVVRDTTYIDNRALLGGIDVCTFDLGLGIHTNFQLFYRYSNSITRFIPIAKVPVLNKSIVSLVLYGKVRKSVYLYKTE
eukprot:gnl/TRDRNA2_/TRDRNA2_177408_c0_seq2.p1 gnl/TRDRNA2_/TRDRNA2_177408_c0~~gnl/TRDRNA2_/TRDRNA2_177408_c0_seq2.p1  ORF type:complete len:657 (-),score=-24.94 gnl/TRDRNA2_/TRDRNA2_177408_c0_seq2:482-2452(-)